jgi:hypothetical protein
MTFTSTLHNSLTILPYTEHVTFEGLLVGNNRVEELQ